MAQWVKDPVLSLLWRRFDPWPGNFHMPQARPKKKVKNKLKEISIPESTQEKRKHMLTNKYLADMQRCLRRHGQNEGETSNAHHRG